MTLPSAAYQVENDQILDDTGQVIQLRGVNWFGFETNDHVAHGLWARNWRLPPICMIFVEGIEKNPH